MGRLMPTKLSPKSRVLKDCMCKIRDDEPTQFDDSTFVKPLPPYPQNNVQMHMNEHQLKELEARILKWYGDKYSIDDMVDFICPMSDYKYEKYDRAGIAQDKKRKRTRKLIEQTLDKIDQE